MKLNSVILIFSATNEFYGIPEFSPFPLLKWCVPAVSSHFSLKPEVSFVLKATKRVETNPSEDTGSLRSALLVGGSAGVGVGDNKAQGSLASQHTERHLPAKPKPPAAEVSPSSLACSPLGFGLNEPGRKAELPKITHSQEDQLRREAEMATSFILKPQQKKKKAQVLHKMASYLSTVKVSQQQPWGWGRISVSHTHDQPGAATADAVPTPPHS